MPDANTITPAVEGWFTMPPPGSGELPTLLGSRCPGCSTYVFPPRDTGCPNPDCETTELERVPLSRHGVVWSYCENHYPPPPPFVAPDPFEPYALAAVRLEDEGLVILGKVVTGVHAADLAIGDQMEVALDTLYRDDAGEHVVYCWAPANRG